MANTLLPPEYLARAIVVQMHVQYELVVRVTHSLDVFRNELVFRIDAQKHLVHFYLTLRDMEMSLDDLLDKIDVHLVALARTVGPAYPPEFAENTG